MVKKSDGWYLDMICDPGWFGSGPLVMTGMLGKAKVPDLPFEDSKGKPYRRDTDYFGNPRNAQTPYTGPIETLGTAPQSIKVWPVNGAAK